MGKLEIDRRGFAKLASTCPAVFILPACSTQQLILNVAQIGAQAIGMGYMAYDMYGETELFREHWKILNDDKLPNPSFLPEKDRLIIEKDLQLLSKRICDEIIRLENTNSALKQARFHKKFKEYPGCKVIVTRDRKPLVRAVQHEELPRIEISIGLLWQHLGNTEMYMLRRKGEVKKEWENKLSGDELKATVTERASIPISLEYKEALLFLLAHESVHIWLDPPDTEDLATLRDQEVRADSMGLNIVSNISYIVDVRRKNEGLEAFKLNAESNSPRSIQMAVLFARSGPEYLFEVNQSIFNANSTIYRSAEQRQEDAAAYMKRAVYGNLQTPNDSYAFYLLSKIKISR